MIATDLAARLVARLAERGLKVTTAESCTGGLIAAAITDVSGSSSVFEEGVVTYSNAAKVAHLGVPEGLLAAHGAVSAEVALAMAEGAAGRTGADIALAVTGIAGPGGATPEKPVGLVHIGVKGPQGLSQTRHVFHEGDRETIRQLTVRAALRAGLAAL